MKPIATILTLVVCIGTFGWLSGAQASEKPDFQVIVEGGMVVPYGNLSDDFYTTSYGFGASKGYEAGFRLRFFLSQFLSVSPAFHFLNPGDFSSEHEEIGEYSLQANSYRYTVEVMLAQAESRLGLRPFLACGFGLYQNRYQGFTKPLIQRFDRTVNTVGFSVRGGVKVKEFEISCVYHFNRFSSYQFFETDQEVDYNWDNMTIRLGWIVPFSD